jgi:hypothetical protein
MNEFKKMCFIYITNLKQFRIYGTNKELNTNSKREGEIEYSIII